MSASGTISRADWLSKYLGVPPMLHITFFYLYLDDTLQSSPSEGVNELNRYKVSVKDDRLSCLP